MSIPDPAPSIPPVTSPPALPVLKTALMVAAAAAVAGLVSWGAGEVTNGFFDPELTLERSLSNEMYSLSTVAAARNTATLFGTLAGVLGLLLGLAGGVAMGNPRRGVVAGAVGMFVGAATAVGMSMLLVPIFKKNYDPDTNDLLLPMAVHAGVWVAAGLGGGLGFGLGLGGARGRVVRSIFAGVVGALVGTAAYEVLGALVFATEKTVEPIAEGVVSRGLAFFAVSLGVAAVIAVSLRSRPAKPTA